MDELKKKVNIKICAKWTNIETNVRHDSYITLFNTASPACA